MPNVINFEAAKSDDSLGICLYEKAKRLFIAIGFNYVYPGDSLVGNI